MNEFNRKKEILIKRNHLNAWYNIFIEQFKTNKYYIIGSLE